MYKYLLGTNLLHAIFNQLCRQAAHTEKTNHSLFILLQISHIAFVYPWKETEHIFRSLTAGHLKGSIRNPVIHIGLPRGQEQDLFDPAPAVKLPLGY